jgi:hypothetical protein
MAAELVAEISYDEALRRYRTGYGEGGTVIAVGKKKGIGPWPYSIPRSGIVVSCNKKWGKVGVKQRQMYRT